MTRRVLILGGAGAIGTRIARLLAPLPDLDFVIAGRDFGRTMQVADDLSESGVPTRSVGIEDVPGLLARERPDVLVDASAPFRGRGLAVPHACIKARIPYIDIAADAEFSIAVRSLNMAAIAAGVPVLTGAGITPCVTFAAIDAIAASMISVEAVRTVICPGNQHPFGPASYAALLARAGKPFRWRKGGAWRTAYNWQGSHRQALPAIGSRTVCALESPDLALLMERWPDLREVATHAGLEIRALQRSLGALAWLARFGANLARAAAPLEVLARTVGHIGTHRFVLAVAVEGRVGRDLVERSWTLLAEDGGHVAAAPAAMLARRILAGPKLPPGARIASVSVSELRAELSRSGCDIRMNETVV